MQRIFEVPDEMPDASGSTLWNRIIDQVRFPPEQIKVAWKLYWLKYIEYNANLHSSPMNRKEHSHTFFEIHMVMEGKLEYLVDGVYCTVDPGRLILFSPGVVHRLTAFSSSVKQCVIAFHVEEADPALSAQLCGVEKRRYYFGQQKPEFVSPLMYTLRYIDEEDPYAPHMIWNMLNVFLLAFLKDIHQTGESAVRPNGEPAAPFGNKLEANDKMVYDAVVTYLTEHINRHVPIEEPARAFLISPKQLNRRLVRYQGVPFSRLQDQIKCARARELLATNMSIPDISEAIGFSSEYSFNRFFKRVDGMTPGRFREALRSSNYK